MKRDQLSEIICGIDDRYIAEAYRFDPARCGDSPERIVPMKKKRILAFALAAALLLSFSIVAYAYTAISTPRAAEEVALKQLAQWRELGLLNPELTFDGAADEIVELEEWNGGAAWYGRLFPHSFDVRWFFGQRKYGCSLNIDTLEGRITSAHFFALPDADAVPSREIELTVGPNEEKETYYYYENFDDLLPAGQTVDGFCTALARYWGYAGYRLADKGDPVYTESYAAHFAQVDGATPMVDVPWDANGTCFLAVYFDGDPEQAPVYLNLMQYPGYVGIDVGISHPVG